MSKAQITCVRKHRNSLGQIVQYEMSDNSGNIRYYDKKGVKKLINDKRYDVVNLQIDRLGRVVDKALDGSLVKEKKLIALFEEAYKYFHNHGMVSIISEDNGKFFLSAPFDKLGKNVNIESLQKQFESYIQNKYGVTLTKLKIEFMNDKYLFIQYGLPYLEFIIEDNKITPKNVKDLPNAKDCKISCAGDKSKLQIHKKIATVKDKRTGQLYENVLLGVFVVDKTNKGAVDYAKHQSKKMEDLVVKMKGEIV